MRDQPGKQFSIRQRLGADAESRDHIHAGIQRQKTIRMFANAAGGLSSGWQDRGSWTVPGSAPAPTDSRKRRKTSTATTTTTTLAPEPTPTIQSGVQALSVTPASGSGSSATFVMRYADSRGARNLVAEWVRFSGGTGMCMIYHERVTNTVYLINDAGSAWHTGLIRSATTLQNGSCAVNLGNSSVSIDGPVLTLNLAISFKASFAVPRTSRCSPARSTTYRPGGKTAAPGSSRKPSPYSLTRRVTTGQAFRLLVPVAMVRAFVPSSAASP